MIIIGIDPGASGGIVVMDNRQPDLPSWTKLDGTEFDTWEWLDECTAGHRHHSLNEFMSMEERCFAYIERVHSMPGQGVSSSFKFGQSYGFLRGLLIALKIPFEEVTPQKWQKAMGCMSKGDKNVTKARAQQLFPQIRVTHAIADCLLIAEFGRRLRAGELQ